MPGATNDTTFDAYKRLTPEEREFFIFSQMCKIDSMDQRFASKWVETGLKSVGTTLVGTLVYIFLNGLHFGP